MKQIIALMLLSALLCAGCARSGYAYAYTGEPTQLTTMRVLARTPTPVPRPTATPMPPEAGRVFGDFVYTAYADGTAEITGTLERKINVRIPESLDGLTVTAIGYRAFFGRADMESVRFPKTLLSIGSEAFAGCTALSEAILPDGAERLGARAFAGCSQLMSVHLPAGLTELGYGAFSDCVRLVAITVPEGVKNLPECAFAGCAELMFAVLPEALESVGRDAFFGCEKLVVRADAGAYAETWAEQNGYPFVFLTGGD